MVSKIKCVNTVKRSLAGLTSLSLSLAHGSLLTSLLSWMLIFSLYVDNGRSDILLKDWWFDFKFSFSISVSYRWFYRCVLKFGQRGRSFWDKQQDFGAPLGRVLRGFKFLRIYSLYCCLGACPRGQRNPT